MRDLTALRRGALVLLVLCMCLLSASPAVSSSSDRLRTGESDPVYVPNAFHLSASNGFTVDVFGIQAFRGRPAKLVIYVRKGATGVQYIAPGTVTETSMHADLGDLGIVALEFKRTDQAVRVPCGKRKIPFDTGAFEGTFRFNGEEGFAEVEATTIPGDPNFVASVYCSDAEEWVGGPEVSSKGSPGAELYVRNPGLGAELNVRKRRPDAAAELAAWSAEYRDGIAIARYIERWVPLGAFVYDRRRRRAVLRPPEPFSGVARFDSTKKAGQRWSGNLTVDLPGKRSLPLVAPGLRATLRAIG